MCVYVDISHEDFVSKEDINWGPFDVFVSEIFSETQYTVLLGSYPHSSLHISLHRQSRPAYSPQWVIIFYVFPHETRVVIRGRLL